MSDPQPKNHGRMEPKDGEDDISRGIHVIQGFPTTLDEATRAAWVCDDSDEPGHRDIGRVVRQTGGAVPGSFWVCIAAGSGLDKWERIGQDVTTAAIEFRIRDADGDDANDGLSDLTPLKTIDEAILRTPKDINHLVKNRIGRHLGGGYAFPLLGIRNYNEILHFIGDGGGMAGEDGFDEVVPLIVAGAGTTEFQIVISPDPGWTVDEHEGFVVEVLDGPSVKYRRLISENTSDTLLLDSDTDVVDATKTLSPGDSIRIVRPNVVWNTGATVLGDHIHVAGGSSLGFKGGATTSRGSGIMYSQMAWHGADVQHQLTWKDLDLSFMGIEWQQASGDGKRRIDWVFQRCAVWLGGDAPNGKKASFSQDVGAVTDTAWSGYGLSWLEPVGAGGPFCEPGGAGSKMNGYFISTRGNALGGTQALDGTRFFWDHVGKIMGRFNSIEVNGVGKHLNLQNGPGVTNPVKMRVAGGFNNVAILNGGSAFVVGPELECVDGACLRAELGGQILEAFSVGAPTGAGLAAFATSGGRISTFGQPILGDAIIADWKAGNEAAFNKTFLSAIDVGVTSDSGSTIHRSFT